ncbi:hypothetical protein HK102_004362 [Quaeritorhiza haematococci]|nr:hypothetical protein HK102_004362 [Quaeritorhiza haematococci]
MITTKKTQRKTLTPFWPHLQSTSYLNSVPSKTPSFPTKRHSQCITKAGSTTVTSLQSAVSTVSLSVSLSLTSSKVIDAAAGMLSGYNRDTGNHYPLFFESQGDIYTYAPAADFVVPVRATSPFLNTFLFISEKQKSTPATRPGPLMKGSDRIKLAFMCVQNFRIWQHAFTMIGKPLQKDLVLPAMYLAGTQAELYFGWNEAIWFNKLMTFDLSTAQGCFSYAHTVFNIFKYAASDWSLGAISANHQHKLLGLHKMLQDPRGHPSLSTAGSPRLGKRKRGLDEEEEEEDKSTADSDSDSDSEEWDEDEDQEFDEVDPLMLQQKGINLDPPPPSCDEPLHLNIRGRVLQITGERVIVKKLAHANLDTEEVAALIRLNDPHYRSHPHKISIPLLQNPIVTAAGEVFLVFPECQTLHQHMSWRDDRIDLDHFLAQPVQGVAFMHQAGIAHCEIKPDNLVVGIAESADSGSSTVAGKLYLIDFGYAVLHGLSELLYREDVGTTGFLPHKVWQYFLKE